MTRQQSFWWSGGPDTFEAPPRHRDPCQSNVFPFATESRYGSPLGPIVVQPEGSSAVHGSGGKNLVPADVEPGFEGHIVELGQAQ
jgi:hypothetical protein